MALQSPNADGYGLTGTYSEWICPVFFVLSSTYSMNSPDFTGYNDGFLGSLLSSDNMSQGPEKIGNGTGQNQIRVGYNKRPLVSVVANTKLDPCGTFDATENFEDIFSVDKLASVGWKISFEDWNKICLEIGEMSNSLRSAGMPIATITDFMSRARTDQGLQVILNSMPFTFALMRDLTQYMTAMRTYINTELVQELYASFIGDFAGPSASTSPLSVDLLNATDGALVYKGFQDIYFEYTKAKQKGMGILVGFNNLFKALSTYADNCCNLFGGELNPQARVQLMNMRYWVDEAIPVVANGATSTQSFVMYSPGSLKMFTRNEWLRTYKAGNVTRGNIADVMFPGLVYDFTMNEDGCTGNGELSFGLGIQFDLWGRDKTTTYAVGDNLSGVNGVFEFTGATI